MKLPTLNFGLVASAVLGFGLIGLSSTPAAAQGTLSEQGWSGDRGVLSCPTGWTNSGDRNFRKCKPNGPDAKPAYIPGQRGQCATGYQRSGDFCLQGGASTASSAPTQTAAAATVRKANALDRCPITYVSDERDLMTCNSRVANPPTVRAKGTAPCPAGSVEDWGIWCVSNYANLTRRDASYVAMDFNTIYQYSFRAIGSQQEPRQPFLPGAASGYSPAYIAIFGRVKYDGSPMDAAAPDAPAAAAATSTAPPSQTAQTQDAPQTPTNCPAPSAGNAQAGANIGSQLGGLLGGRRGNSQAGAALGGLLGAVAGSRQPNKPVGCP